MIVLTEESWKLDGPMPRLRRTDRLCLLSISTLPCAGLTSLNQAFVSYPQGCLFSGSICTPQPDDVPVVYEIPHRWGENARRFRPRELASHHYLRGGR
jgi:hypothetical protein